ncbi:hypothetical protein DY000_02043494 [Brassica cretica]|uniref:Uncharacterized protein n=1 Tax=Brassica cretica TaxID=69181 RepID=A0ABQ7B7M4_BRACR|nr:hypothetical protein DY000_02043494 [Brassica cretica]
MSNKLYPNHCTLRSVFAPFHMELVLPIYNRPRTLLFRQRLQFHHERRVDAVGEVEEVGGAGHSEDASIDGFMGSNASIDAFKRKLPAHDLPSIDGF